MKFEHLVINIEDDSYDIEEERGNQVYIFLDDNVDSDDEKIVAQAISLDIRGDFGFFLNKQSDKRNICDRYEWIGNLFHITVDNNKGIVKLVDITDEENEEYLIKIQEWQEALEDWKEFYLIELGFLPFKSMAINHMLGVLILTYDQMDQKYCSNEMLIEAIKKCSKRYGISKSVIYRDCKKVIGVTTIEQFYNWACEVLENKSIIFKHNIFKYIKPNEDIQAYMLKYLGIKL